MKELNSQKNMITAYLQKLNRFAIILMGLLLVCASEVYAGSAYSDGRAYLRAGSPSGAGKVYVSTSSSTPAASAYKACNTVQTSESTSPSASAQVEGEKKKTTYHFWAQANAGYKFVGWYTSTGTLATADAHYSGTVTSGTAGSSDTHAYLDMHAAFIKIIQMGFVRPENGSFTINHNGSEVANYASFTVDGAVKLTALPADGYKLRGWYTTTNGGVTKNYFAFGSTCEPNFTSNVTIGAEFVPDDGKAAFWIKGTNKIFDDLNNANNSASSGNIIVVVSDGVVGAGTYTINSGVTLLIPYDETYNLMTTPKVQHYTSAGSAPALSAFRRLTLAPGAIINCSGNICIGGQQTAVNGGNPTSLPCGAAGVLDMSRGGTINLKSGSNLYAWGFVKGQDMDQGNNTDASGVGVINAASGATVWEDYQCGEWRGGTASSTIYSNKGSWKFFPFQSYSIQNVEVPVNYATGSNLKCHWAIFGNGSTFTVTFPLVASSNSLFKLASGGTLRKWYDPTTDRVCYELGGTTSLDALNLNVLGESVSSSDYNLPIPANMHIILKSGNALTISKPMTAHAGAVVEVKSGATLNVNAKVYMYDADDWDTYCMYAYYYRTYKNLTSHYDRGTGTSKTNLEDATLIVDGTVNIANQCLYTTAHGASIIGNGGGTFKYNTLPSNTTMTQCKVLSDNVSVNIRSANLRNDNGSYTKGIASTTFKNVNGRWFTETKSTEKANHTYDFTYIKSGDVYGTAGTNGTVAACYSKDKTGLALQNKWANIKAEGCDNWWTGIDDSHLYNYTLNSAWHQYIKTGSTAGEEGEDPIETYAGSDGKVYQKQGCNIVVDGTMENCLYGTKALVNGAFITVEKNTAPDEGYHKSGAATTYYLCFDGCVWHPATRDAENLYTVDGTKYIWYNNAWLAVTYDSTVKLYYSLSATNVRIYYEYINNAWVLASPVAEVVTSAGTEQVFSLANAITKAKAGGTNVTIRLLKNISGTISYDGTNNCGLDLNGYTLSSSTDKMINVNNASATFIIKDQSADGKGKVKLNYSANARRYAVYVTNGHAMLNSGTIEAINTMSYDATNAKTTQVCAVYVAASKRFTMNGGKIEAKAAYNPYAIYGDGAATTITINGGTINCTSTQVSSPYAIISYGETNIHGGTINAIAETTSGVGVYVHASTSKQGHLTMTGGSIYVESKGSTTATGILVNRGLSYNSTDAEPRTIKQEYPAQADISGGTVTVKTKTTTRQAISSYGTTNITGGKFIAKEGTTTAFGVRLYAGTTTISGSAEFDVQATNTAYGVRISEEAPDKKGGPLYNGTLIMNGGKFTVTTTSDKPAYGVYVGAESRNVTTTHASDASFFAGNYANAGTATINDGEINATAKTTDAYAVFVEAALSGTFTGNNTPKLTINGGKFMAKNSNGSANGAINNTAAAAANFKLTGGYYNIAPAGSYVIAGKSVKDVEESKEPAIFADGYLKKIAGNEYTVTWKSFNGATTLGTSQVESGQVPVWTGERPDYKDATSEREWIGWATDTWNRGTKYVNGTPLPAIAASDVTYYAACQAIYADVTAGGTTTRYNSAQTAWTEAMKHKQATIRILSNLGSEANVGNMTELVFNPANEGSIITLDLNGHIWTMGNHSTAANNKNIFLKVSPSKANCKLIVTDNSASGNGYLMNKHDYAANLICAYVSAGELILQGGGLKCSNTNATNNAIGVQTNGGVFTMTGGIVESKKDGDAVTSGTASGVYCYSNANLSGGTIRATNAKANAVGVYVFRNNASTVLEEGLTVEANAKTGAWTVHGYGTVDIQGGTYRATATTSNARGIYIIKSGTNLGQATVSGNPTFTVSSPTGNFGVLVDGDGSDEVYATIEGGTFNVTSTTGNTAVGVRAQNNGIVTVKDGSFTTNLEGAEAIESFGASVMTNGTVNIEGGTFNVNSVKQSDNSNGVRCYTGAETKLNISGGTFTVVNGQYAVRCFGGETTITGNPTFTARFGVDAGSWAAAAGTAKVTIDGGTFICTEGFALNSTTHTHATNGTVTGDLTVWDGRFYSASTYPISYSEAKIPYTKIRGGYYSYYSSSNVDSRLKPFVVSPSTVEAYATTIDGKAYTYRVNTKYNVTFSVNGVNTVKQYNRNETPSFGSTPAINDGNTYDFIGWTPEIAPVTTDVTYTAQFKKWEAEIIMPNGTSKRYESFTTAWTDALQIQNCTIRVLSNVYYSTSLTYNPAPPAGTTAEDEAYFTNATTTLDLNNHIVNYTPATATYALTINKTGSKLIIDDSSTQKGGQFGHRQNASKVELLGIYVQNGELQLAGGTIIAKNTCIDGESGAGAKAIVGGGVNSIFNMTGGTLLAQSRLGARAYNSSGDGVFNATGGDIIATTEYTESSTTKWGANAYGVILWNYGSFNMSGTTKISVTSGSGAIGVYPYGGDKKGYPIANISGGSISCLTKTGGTARSVNIHGARATANISGGDITANGPAGQYNIEDVSVHHDAVANITGGNFHSTTGANCVGVRVFGGTATISSNAFFDCQRGVVVGDWAEAATATATAYINGGTFDCPVFAVLSKSTTNKYDGTNDGTVTGTTYVNGGYFKTASGQKICSTSSETGRLILNGGYYNETSGTTQKSNITTYKGSTTQVNTLSPAITVDGRTYHYELKTKFNVTWKGGTSYNKVEELWSGTMPSNAECTSFVRNDSTFYFTGWTPTPSPVITDITYQAEGEYHVAKVKIGSGAWTIYDDFNEAWNDAMAATNANVNITLLNNVTLDDYLAYTPAIANARTTLDLNNFTLTQNSALYSIHVNKADAKLTITDTSADKGGCIYKKMSSSTSIYGVYVYNGEAIMAGGKIYCENTIDNTSWHPAGGLYNASANAKITVTGGTVEAAAQITAYAITGYGPVNVSGGLVKATVKKYNNARALSQQMNTATITGGTFEAYSTGNATGIYTVMAGAWIGSTAASAQSATVNISGGKFKAQTASSSAVCAFADGVVKKIGEEIVTAHGTLTITGGEFTTLAPAATATQIFSVVSSGARLFDDDHNLIGESRAETTISGGTFLVDTRNDGAYVVNKNNNDILRCWGTINITGGTFTIYQNSGATGIGCYRGKVTISGNPVFNINGTTQTRGIIAGPWNHSSYCDKDATNNLAEIEVNGGTFNVTANGTDGNVIGAWTNGSISSTSATDAAALAGYAMSSKITINGGEFICSGQKQVRTFYQYGSVEGTYGTAKREIFVNGGKFKSQIATFNADGTINTVTGAGANVETGNASVKLAGLTGGYYSNNNHLEANRADTCDLITLEETDPEYANGYRYKIEPHYVAKVSKAGASDRFFCVMKDAFDYAKTQDNSTITLLRTVDDYVGPTLYYDPSSAKSCIFDLNGFTFKGQATSGEPDRLLIVSKGGCTFTIKDSSTGKTGKFSHEKNGANFAAVVYHGTLVLESGTVHCKNTSGGAQALRSTEPDAIIQMTGGKAHAEATGTAYAVNSYGPATITGGLLLAEGADARGVNSQDANADVKVKGNAVVKAIASAETAYGLYVAGGGKLTISENACDTAICTTKAARGAYVGNGQLTISGNAKIRANAGTASYTVLAQGDNANATIEGGTITSYSSANSASITVYALLGATAHITGGTFYALDNISNASNVSPIRTGDNATMTIDGGIFYGGESGTQFQAVSIRGGETTINGGTFNAAVGIRAMDWADATTITGKLTVKGGTFNTTSQTIYVSSKANNSRNAHSEVTIEGGKFKTTGSTIVQMDAAPAGTTASTLTITGGYFNEKSGTTFKNQIANFVSDPYEVFTLEDGDANKTAGYTYEVCEKRVAKVKTGSTTTYYTTIRAALAYAKTVANPTITLLDNCTLSPEGDANYNKLTTASWTGTLDLNNFTLTPTIDGNGRALTVGGSKSKLTITDNSVSKGGQIYYQGSHSGQFIYIVVEDGAEVELAGGTLYMDNTSASGVMVGFVINGTTAKFKQTAGTFTLKSKDQAKVFYGTGKAEFTGGTINVEAETQAIGLNPNTASTVLNISGTFKLNVKAVNAYGVYASAGTTTIEGTPDFYVEGSTRARVLQGTNTGNLTVNSGTFEAKITSGGESDSYVLIPEGSSTITVNGGKFSSNKNHIAYKSSTGTLAIKGGYFNESTGTYHKSEIETYCVAPKHCLPMTAAEIATVGSDYKYKVVDAYTLTWTTDGDALTGTYTQGITAAGATITAPATPTKTGYTFAAWTPAFTGTMPAANTTYTATWTVNSYTIRFLNHDGTVLQTGSVNYGETPAYAGDEPTKPTDATYSYTFSGWSPAISAVSGAQDYTAQFEQTANVVASVKIGSTTTYYTTLADAFNKAETGDNALITMLQDVEGLTTQLQYNPTSAYKCTLDLNNHKVEGTIYSLLYINKSKSTFTITDNSAEKEGQISSVYTGTAVDNATRYGVYVNAGNLVLEEGTIYFENRRPRADGTSLGAVAVGVNNSAGYTFTMNGGTVEAKGNYRAYGVYSNGTTKINSGTVKATVPAGTNHSIAYGVAALANTTTINDGATITVEAPTAAYGVASLSSTNSKTGAAYKSTLTVEGGTINVTTTTGKNAYGAYTVPATRTITKTETDYTPGEYGAESTLKIHGGTFNVTSHTSGAYGVYAGLGAFYTKTTPNEVKTLYQSTVEITGGTFNVKTAETTGTSTAEGVRSFGQTIISGGTFDIKANTSTAYGVHVYKGKTTINGNPSFTVRANATVYGASAGETPSETTGMPYDGELEINGGTFDVATTSKASTDNKSVYGVRAYANKRQITNTASGYYIGNYASAGTVTVNGGEFIVDGNYAIAGIICSGIVTQPAATISEIACPAASATAKMTVNGGKFKVTGTSYVYATNDAATTANFKLQGGYFNIDDGISKYVAPTKSTSPYYCVPTTAADKAEVGSDYEYKVAVAYKLTWNLDGGDISVAGTPAGYVAVGDPITAPVVTKTGYTFAGWTPAVATTMPAANTTYTATWKVDIVGDRLDIVDWTATDLTINANGWKASGWPYSINGTSYEKGARAADRTLTIPYSAEAGTLMCLTVESGGTITSQHFYRVPFIETTTGVKAEDTIYVNSGTLAIDASSLSEVGGLYICPGASVNITKGMLSIGKLVLRTLPWQAASISGDFTATKTYYTRIAPNKRTIRDIQGTELSYEAASYYQFALPLGCEVALKDVKVSNQANTPYGNTWLLKRYNEANRAEEGTKDDANWVALGENYNIQGGVGYELFSNSAYYREFYFPVDPTKAAQTTSVSYDLGAAGEKHAGWNIVSSPLMATYTNTSDPESGLKVSWYLSDGSYDQVIPSYIYPAIPFSYQASEGQHSISFEGNAIVAAAPRRMAVEDEPVRLQWIHVDVKDAQGVGDQTSILSHPTRYEESYKTGIDVAKQSLTASRALLYSTHAYGDMAFAGVSDSKLTNGIPLVVYSPKAQELTISMRENAWLNRLTAVWLIDHETGIRTDLLWSTYTFDATEGTAKGRFTLMGEFKAPQVTTGLENGQSDQEPSTKARKVIIEDKIYIQLNGRMYDSTGKLVNQ